MTGSVDSSTGCCVLGATGFIGGQIARAAVARGWRVRGIRRRPDSVGAIGDLEVEWRPGDLSDRNSLETAMRGCSLVFHAAGFYPIRAFGVQEVLRRGVGGMRNVLAAAAAVGVDRLVYTSSFTTVGPPSEPGRMANESDVYCPGSISNPYYEVKWAMEMEAMRFAARGMNVISVLPSAVFGPGDVKPATGAVLIMAAAGQIPGYVDGMLNVVDVRDVANGHIAAADHGQPGHRYILGGHNLTIREILTTATESAGKRSPRFRLPHWLIKGAAALGGLAGLPGTALLRAIDHWQPLDTRRAHEDLRVPAPIPFEQTCRDALAWFREHGYLKRARSKHPTMPSVLGR